MDYVDCWPVFPLASFPVQVQSGCVRLIPLSWSEELTALVSGETRTKVACRDGGEGFIDPSFQRKSDVAMSSLLDL